MWRRGCVYLAQLSPAYFESGQLPYGHDQYISASAGSLAAMALSDALPMLPKVAAVRRGRPFWRKEAWIETILFGSTADVNFLIQSWIRPAVNWPRSPEARRRLMMAAPDAEKMKRS